MLFFCCRENRSSTRNALEFFFLRRLRSVYKFYLRTYKAREVNALFQASLSRNAKKASDPIIKLTTRQFALENFPPSSLHPRMVSVFIGIVAEFVKFIFVSVNVIYQKEEKMFMKVLGLL